MNFKKYFTLSIISVTVFITLMGITFAFILIYDNPLQIYKQNHFNTEKYYPVMRLQARGIIKNVDFDSIILGTSLLENTSSIEAGNIIGGKYINISMPGLNFFERNIILTYIFKIKKIKHVIYSIENTYSLYNEKTLLPSNWNLLYDYNDINDFLALYSKPIMFSFLKNFYKPEHNVYDDITFFDRPQEWFSDKSFSTRYGCFKNWFKNHHHSAFIEPLTESAAKVTHPAPAIVPTDDAIKIKNYVDTYVLRHIKENPDTKFYLVLGPYHRFKYADMRQVNTEQFYIHQTLIRHLVANTKKYKNLEVYGFEDQDFVDDISRYMDFMHYDVKINSFITQSIAQKKHLLTPENVETYLTHCEKLALAFDIKALYDEMQKIIKLNEVKKQ